MGNWGCLAPVLLLFWTASDSLSCFMYRRTTGVVDALAGGGFGAQKRQSSSKSQTKPASNNTKPKNGRSAALRSFRPKENNINDQIQLDKWGLPPPTVEDIFPPMSADTELVPVESQKEYSLAEIQQALKNHIPLPNLKLRFDENGDENMTVPNDPRDKQREPMKLHLLHQCPPVLAIDHFFTLEECQETQQIAAMPIVGSLQTTTTKNSKKAPLEVESKTFSALAQSKRTSTSWFCYYESVPTLLAKTRAVLGTALEQMEEPQIVRYRPGQEFSWHYDEVPSPQLSNGGQRLATLLVYLNTVPEGGGGGTVFRDLRDSNGRPLTVQPVQGRALLFFPAFADGRPDDRTLHQGEQIVGTNVEKRIIQMWIHERAYRAAVPPRNRQEDAFAAVDQASQRLGYHL